MSKIHIKNYFFGQLTESEQQNFEAEYFANPEVLQLFLADSNDLIDEFLRGKLSPTEHRKFEERLTQIPALREKIETDRALLQVLATVTSVNYQLPESTRRWSLSQWWSELSFSYAMTAALLFVAIIGGLWYGTRKEKPEVVKQEVVNHEVLPRITEKPVEPSSPASSPKKLNLPPSPKSIQPSSENPPTPVIASFFLSGEILRGNEGPVKLSVAPEVTTLRLQLELNSETPKKLQAELQTMDGATIKAWKSLPLVYRKSTPLIEVNLSTAALVSKDYVIKLSNSPQEFYFRIQKQ